jgi:SAM-dependent methyltransferase
MTATVSADQFADRLFQSSLSTIDVLATYVGDRLGWYKAMASGGPATPAELVERAGGSVRYAREWLEQQAATGILTLDSDGRFELPPGPAEVLTDADSLLFLAPLARMLSAAAIQLPALTQAYREGGGVSWEEYGREMRESQADMNRPWFINELAGALAKVDAVDAVLRRPGALVADIGCGAGWSSLALAKAYPQARVDAWDIDAPSVDMARENAAAAGLEDRVIFSAADARRLGGASYDAIFAFECIHDMARPVEVLAELRRAVKPDGVVVVMDEAVSDAFEGPANEVDRLMYGFSLLVCLPDGLSSQPSAGTGTVMRIDTLRSYATEAGFRNIDVLPTGEFGFWRFYRLLT